MEEIIPPAALSTELVEQISSCLSKGMYSDALSAINDNKYSTFLIHNAWDLIPVIANYITDENNKNSPQLVDCCEQLLQIIANKSKPEEALLEFIELVELAKEDTLFFVVLKSLKIILRRCASKRGQSIEWCLNAIQTYIGEIEVPGDYSVEEAEQPLLDNDIFVNHISTFYTDLLPFYRPLVEEVALPNHQLPEHKQRRDLLASYLIQLLGRPLANLNLECSLESKSRARLCSEKIMSYLGQLVGDCYKFLQYIPDRYRRPMVDRLDCDDSVLDVFASEERTPTLALGVYYYLILAENVRETSMLSIYSPMYLFEHLFYVLAEMLKQPEQFIVRKGLLLGYAMICGDLIPVFPCQLLECTANAVFCKNITKIMTYANGKDDRTLAIKIFKTYLFKFDHKGRYLLITYLMDTLTHMNTVGYVISQYKEMIRLAFVEDENRLSEYYSGPNLFNLLDIFCCLPEGAKTDLVEITDKIVNSLNLIIFLAIRDRYNATGIWNHFDKLQKNFFTPLKEAIDLSKAHYKLRMMEVRQERGGGDADIELTVSGERVNLPDKDRELAFLRTALNTFDVKQMLLARIQELIDEGPLANI